MALKPRGIEQKNQKKRSSIRSATPHPIVHSPIDGPSKVLSSTFADLLSVSFVQPNTVIPRSVQVNLYHLQVYCLKYGLSFNKDSMDLNGFAVENSSFPMVFQHFPMVSPWFPRPGHLHHVLLGGHRRCGAALGWGGSGWGAGSRGVGHGGSGSPRGATGFLESGRRPRFFGFLEMFCDDELGDPQVGKVEEKWANTWSKDAKLAVLRGFVWWY